MPDATPERAAEWRALADAATPGPWHAHFGTHGDPEVVLDPAWSKFTRVADVSTASGDYGRADARFIAAARDAVPALLDLVERLTGERDAALRELLAETYRPEGGEIVMRELGRVKAERDAARAAALREAAAEVHTEARWQMENRMRATYAHGTRSIDRLMVVERILLDRAAALAGPERTTGGRQA